MMRVPLSPLERLEPRLAPKPGVAATSPAPPFESLLAATETAHARQRDEKIATRHVPHRNSDSLSAIDANDECKRDRALPASNEPAIAPRRPGANVRKFCSVDLGKRASLPLMPEALNAPAGSAQAATDQRMPAAASEREPESDLIAEAASLELRPDLCAAFASLPPNIDLTRREYSARDGEGGSVRGDAVPNIDEGAHRPPVSRLEPPVPIRPPGMSVASDLERVSEIKRFEIKQIDGGPPGDPAEHRFAAAVASAADGRRSSASPRESPVTSRTVGTPVAGDAEPREKGGDVGIRRIGSRGDNRRDETHGDGLAESATGARRTLASRLDTATPIGTDAAFVKADRAAASGNMQLEISHIQSETLLPPQPIRSVAAQIADAVVRDAIAARGETPTVRASLELRTIRMDIEPAGLGHVTIHMRLTGDRLDLKVRAHEAETSRILESDRSNLAKIIRDAGYVVDQFDIEARPIVASGPTIDPAPTQGFANPDNSGQRMFANEQGRGAHDDGRNHAFRRDQEEREAQAQTDRVDRVRAYDGRYV